VRRTWGPVGQTPVIEHVHDRRSVSAIGAISVSPVRKRLGCYLHLWRDTIDSEAVAIFVRGLLRHLRGRIILVWDRLGAHRKAAEALAASHRRLWLEWLPPYAPELNPVEWKWEHMKDKQMANLCPENVDGLLEAIGQANADITQDLLRGFIRGSELRWRI
jgi:transposase